MTQQSAVKIEEMPGVETICGLIGSPPEEIPISYDSLTELQFAINDLNRVFIAIIPYCYKCREPLIWIRCSDPKQEIRLFRCNKCGRTWTKGEGFVVSGSRTGGSTQSSEHLPETTEDTGGNTKSPAGTPVCSEARALKRGQGRNHASEK